MKRKIYLFIFFCFSVLAGKAQIGGEYTYQFLELTNSARIAALGGTQIAILDSSDLNLAYNNPSLLHKEMANRVLVNYVNYLTDINYGYVSYAKSFEGIGNFAVGMHYINYGKFDEATETGELTGATFNAAEYALNLIYSNNYKRLNYGINIKPILSSFESYQSVGIAADLGVNFSSKGGNTTVAMVARNIGTQITTYYENGNRESIPFNFLKQSMRHLILGIELLPSENFILRVGYNYQRRQELMFEEKASLVGFSTGFGIKIKRFRLDYGISRFHLAGSSNLFSLSINLNNNF